MTSLQLAYKARQLALTNKPARLYKCIIRYVLLRFVVWSTLLFFLVFGTDSLCDTIEALVVNVRCSFLLSSISPTRSFSAYCFPFFHSIMDSEIPRVLMIYDIVNYGEMDVRKTIRQHFYQHKDIKDTRIIDMLVELGYIDLEDTLLQHKQKPHLMLLLEGRSQSFNYKHLSPDATEEEQMQRWLT
jgi:NADH dehydrogenase (ubiquinone) 1 alpha subcomplex subunit 6